MQANIIPPTPQTSDDLTYHSVVKDDVLNFFHEDDQGAELINGGQESWNAVALISCSPLFALLRERLAWWPSCENGAGECDKALRKRMLDGDVMHLSHTAPRVPHSLSAIVDGVVHVDTRAVLLQPLDRIEDARPAL